MGINIFLFFYYYGVLRRTVVARLLFFFLVIFFFFKKPWGLLFSLLLNCISSLFRQTFSLSILISTFCLPPHTNVPCFYKRDANCLQSLWKGNLISLLASSDRGNDNWLIKYEKPGDGELTEKVSWGIFIEALCLQCWAAQRKCHDWEPCANAGVSYSFFNAKWLCIVFFMGMACLDKQFLPYAQ